MQVSLDRERERRGMVAVSLGLLANVFLAALKTGVGIVGHSPALLADGISEAQARREPFFCNVLREQTRYEPPTSWEENQTSSSVRV